MHDHHASTGTASAGETAIDPVCGMKVAIAPDRPQAEWNGTTYSFCCTGCRDAFLADPPKYLDKKPIDKKPAPRRPAPARPAAPSEADGAALYTCPMHPEI